MATTIPATASADSITAGINKLRSVATNLDLFAAELAEIDAQVWTLVADAQEEGS